MIRLFIHAVNIHQGGGAILLREILNSVPKDITVTASVDARVMLSIDVPSNILIEFVKPSLLARFLAEIKLLLRTGASDRVFCFGNLPPLFHLKGKVFVYIQNRYLIDKKAPIKVLPNKLRIRIIVERAWLILLQYNAKYYFVQTPSMKLLAEERINRKVSCLPLLPEIFVHSKVESNSSNLTHFDFLYVASSEPHKNHVALIAAWSILANEGLYPSLALTLSEEIEPILVKYIKNESTSKGLKIHILGLLPYEKLIALYRESSALIYPSSFESFGLPLIEAKKLGLAILAPELDYVRDIVNPDQSFDPHSPISISRAVKRHMNLGQPSENYYSGKKLIDILLSNSVA